MGGTRADDILPLLAGSSVQYFPFPGKIVGHPSVLEGSIDEIAASAKYLASHEGVHGLDLLAYRSPGDVKKLMAAVCAVTEKPIIMAGSIDTREQIAEVRKSGAAGFTIGTAALDGAYPAQQKDLSAQLYSILKDVAELNHHITSISPKNLADGFSQFDETWSPRIAGQVNNMHIKLAKFEGDFVWYHHSYEDELFLVHKGQLMMKFRDRDEIINEGEFIIVPHGVEHCPVAVSDVCEVVLLEPVSTLSNLNSG